MSINPYLAALIGGSKSKHGIEPYTITRSDGKVDTLMMPNGRHPEQHGLSVPEGTVFTVQRAGGSMVRHFIWSGGLCLRLTSAQFATAWMGAVAKHKETTDGNAAGA